MSGQTGAAREAEYFLVEYTSGVIDSIEVPPWERNPDDYLLKQFEDMSRPYKEKLEKVVQELNEYFEILSALDEFPIVEYKGKREWISGVVIEDTEKTKRDKYDERHGKNWLTNSKGQAAYVMARVNLEQQGCELVELTFTITRQILRSQIDQIERKITEIFTRPEGTEQKTNEDDKVIEN